MKTLNLLFALLFFIHLNSYSQKYHFDDKPFVKGEMLVQLQANKSLKAIIYRAPLKFDVQYIEELSKPMRISLISFDHDQVSHSIFQSWLYAQPEVTVADYNYYVQMRSTLPSDPSFTSQWHHNNTGASGGTVDADIDSDLAWDITTGGMSATNDDIVVCMVEGGGGNLDHQDLSPNRWINTAEIPNDNIDNDANGYVDDYNGWNTGSNNDDYGNSSHGTNCLGMIGAKGNNNIDVAGANWDVKMMVINMGGSLTQANVVSAYTYPLVMRQMWNESNGSQGAFVVATSASWGIDGANPSSYPLWCQFYDTLGYYGILNVGATTNSNLDVDVAGDMPTACASNYMIGVGRTGNQDQTAGGYGDQTIELGAPGINVVTTNGTSSGSTGITSTTGTSFSCPLTAGVIGLAYSIPCPSFMSIVKSTPQVGADLVLQALLTGTDPKPQLSSKFVTGGRLNSRNTLDNLMASVCSGNICLSPSSISINNISTDSADVQFIPYNSASSTTFYWREVGAPSWSVVSNAISPIDVNNLMGCTDYEFYFESVCSGDTSSQTSVQTFSTFGCGNCVDLPYCTSAASDAIDEWIETFDIGTYSFNSGNDNGYGNFISSLGSIDLSEGFTYNISVSPAWSGTLYNEQSRIWIDLNQDGNFAASELVYDQGAATQTPATGAITIPSGTMLGNTRLRVQMAYVGGSNSLPGVCDQFTWGEVEDYCINIVQGMICGMNVTSTVVAPKCIGIDDGSINVSVSGGFPSYSYDWGSSFGTNPIIDSLSAGSYTLVITDSLQCDTIINYNLSYETTIVLNSNFFDVSCNGANDGSIVVNPSGSSGFNFDWGGSFGNVSSLSSLSAGNYTVNVTDTNGCMQSTSFNITEPSADQVSYTHSTADLTVTFTNTSSMGSYSWDFGDGTSSSSNSPWHTYSSSGTYTACLNLTTSCNAISYCTDITVENQSTVDLGDNLLDLIKVYPNPASSTVFFSLDYSNAAKIYIIDATGKVIESRVIKDKIEEFNISRLNTGIYSYQIRDKNDKLIKSSKLNILK
jgi:hypothetical protein